MARTRRVKSTFSRCSWRHARRKQSVQHRSPFKSPYKHRHKKIKQPTPQLHKNIQRSPFKSSLHKNRPLLKSPSQIETKSPAAKRMRFSELYRHSTRKSPFKSSNSSPYKSPLPRHSNTTQNHQILKSKTSTRQLFDNTESEILEDFTELSRSTLSASDSENDENLTELPNDNEKTTDNHEFPNNENERLPESEIDTNAANGETSTEIPNDNEKNQETDVVRDIEQMKELTPKVHEILSKTGMHEVLVSFFEMVASETFPQDNIAFLLWAEVVKWFKTLNTTQMRYSKETKLFWKLGWRLFGKRFLNFMGGFKSHGELLSNVSSKGQFDPKTSEINFAVPDVSVLRAFDPYDTKGARPPGIFADTISDLGQSMDHKSACLTFDGKKIKQGLTESTGDVDLLGHESGQTLFILHCKLFPADITNNAHFLK